MSHTYINLLVHVIFTTKNREPCLLSEIRPRLFAYMGGIMTHLKGVALEINGTDDHVHLLLSLPATLAVAETVRAIKANSSHWLRQTGPQFDAFSWQTGYGAFSVSESMREAVVRYIANQEQHHRLVSLEEEMQTIIRRHPSAYGKLSPHPNG
jgi:REP element-mobilizing transposase RayT